MRHADADAACGCVKRHAFCLIPCVRNAVRFICIFRRRLVCKWRRIGPCCSDWTMFYKMSLNENNHPCRGTRNEYNGTMLVGRLIGSHREVGREGGGGGRERGREGLREEGRQERRERGREGERQGVRREGGRHGVRGERREGGRDEGRVE